MSAAGSRVSRHVEEALQALSGETTPAQLSLAGKRIDARDVSSMCPALALNRGLLRLNLSDNPIGDEGATLLAAALAPHPSLQTLTLRSIGMSDLGANCKRITAIRTALLK